MQGLQRQDPNTELYTLLDLLFTPTHPLYQKTSALARLGPGPEDGAKTDRWDTAYATYPFCLPSKQMRHISPYFARNLNTFGQKGGFNAYLAWVEGPAAEAPPLALLKKLIKPLKNVTEYLSGRFTVEFVQRLCDSTFNLLLSLENEVVRSEREVCPLPPPAPPCLPTYSPTGDS